eukprot:13781753-Alexandrium_andersonii.AAC.1
MSVICCLASRSLGETSGCAGGGERDRRSPPNGPGLKLPLDGERAIGDTGPPGLGIAGGLSLIHISEPTRLALI